MLDLLTLPPENRLEIAKKFEEKFCNPESVDIFTEDEAGYNFSMIRKRDTFNEETFDEHVLEELFYKAKRTVEVLSPHLLLSHGLLDDIVDQL